jgi:hypothetical protein
MMLFAVMFASTTETVPAERVAVPVFTGRAMPGALRRV